jgi:cell division protein FtsB
MSKSSSSSGGSRSPKRSSKGRRRPRHLLDRRRDGSKKAAAKRTPHQRRIRALIIGSALFSALVLGTSFPLSVLLSQREQLSSTAGQLKTIERQNSALRHEAQQLAKPSIIDEIARRDYGLVAPGSQAFEVIPMAGSSTAGSQGAGTVPLDGPPVVPGSQQSQDLLDAGALSAEDPSSGSGDLATQSRSPQAGSGEGTGTSGNGSRDNTSSTRATVSSSSDGGGFWSRVAHTLEFWR